MATRAQSSKVSAKAAALAGIRQDMKAEGRLPATKKVQTTIICNVCHVGAWHADVDENGVCKFCR